MPFAPRSQITLSSMRLVGRSIEMPRQLVAFEGFDWDCGAIVAEEHYGRIRLVSRSMCLAYDPGFDARVAQHFERGRCTLRIDGGQHRSR